MQPNRARNRALLIGTGWTLAAAVALAWFKSSPAEPIYLWSLGVVAFGWAGVLLHALHSGQRAADASLAALGGDTRAVIDGLAQAVGIQMQRAGSELLRVDELLEHAIERLMTAFNDVSEQARCHQRVLALATAAAQGATAAERLRAAAERVAIDVNGAVTALQFRDVVGQKLGHVRRELEALEQVMLRIREASSAPSAPAAALGRARAPEPERARLAALVRGLLRELEQAKAASPAQQELMHAGEVDLF
ncbi:MAG: hypothetical protein HY848_11210 [Betaproteobacteria bacterium]|nr:hypothetical protein [Betaproteobacteria bacterium]